MDDCLIDIMLEMVKNNQYQNGTFRPGTYKEMERQLNLLEPECGVRVDPHIQSRLKTLKKKYNGVKELRSLSGAGWKAAQDKEKGQPSVSSKPKNKRHRVGEVEAEAESVSVGKELLAELKPMMEVFTVSLGDALRGETVVEHEPVQDELARMRKGIQDELETLNGLTRIKKIQAALILVDSTETGKCLLAKISLSLSLRAPLTPCELS
ncbi:hypothetical protein LINGRAHAP2_LOCUS7862 [Linum grandiflorum]